MAEKIHQYFLKAGLLGGVPAKMRLYNLTCISSSEAKKIKDTPDLIEKFESQFKVIEKEFKESASSPIIQDPHTFSPSLTQFQHLEKGIEKLRKQISIIADLTTKSSNFKVDFQAATQSFTECLAEAIEVERASIWLYNKDESAIECIDLYLKSKKQHSSGLILKEKDFPNYFKALASQRTIASINAHKDPCTSEFSNVYLKPNHINSMLDVPIWSKGKMVGVVCHEHTGDFRLWTSDEENFAYLMGNIIAMAMENQNHQYQER
jgi:hypothetical protein